MYIIHLNFSPRAMKRTSRKIVNITYKVVDTLDKKSMKFMKMLFQFRKKSLEYGRVKGVKLIHCKVDQMIVILLCEAT